MTTGVCPIELVEKSTREGLGVVPITGVERGLAAAGLGRVECHLGAQSAEHAERCYARLREEVVDDASDEQLDAPVSVISAHRPVESDSQPSQQEALDGESDDPCDHEHAARCEAASLRFLPRGTCQVQVGHKRNQARRDEPDRGQVCSKCNSNSDSGDGPYNPVVEPLEDACMS